MSDPVADAEESAFGGLTPLITDDADLGAAMSRIAVAGCRYVPRCVAASVTVIEGERGATVGSSNAIAGELDQVQYDVDEGPCLAAARRSELVIVADVQRDGRWPRFAKAALQRGVRSSLSMPIPVAAEGIRAGLNLHSASVAAFGEAEQRAAEAFAVQASAVIANAQAYWAALQLSRNLSAALESRPLIDQAKGVLMGRHRISADEAFDRLRQQSQLENRKLRDVAQHVVDQLEVGEHGEVSSTPHN